MPGFRAVRLSRKRFRALIGGRGEVNGSQKDTDQHDEQVDFHVALHRAIAATTRMMQGAFQSFRRSNASRAIKNG